MDFGGIITNIFSSLLYDKAGAWCEGKKIEKFYKELLTWITSYIVEHDGTIMTSDKFCMFTKNHKIIESIIEYVTQIYREDRSEDDFIKSILKDLEEYFKDDELTPLDISIVKNLFSEMLRKVKNFAYNQLDANHKTLMYMIFQTKYEVDYLIRILHEQKKINFSNLDLIKSFIENVRDKQDNLSIYNITYYKAWIKDYGDRKMMLYANKNVGRDYDSIFYKISEILSCSWKRNLIDSLEDNMGKVEQDSDYYRKLKDGRELINNNIDYNITFNIIDEIIVEFKQYEGIYKDIREKLDSRFNKVVIISGEPRVGKTHFLKEYIRYILVNKAVNFIIPIDYDELIDIDLKGVEDLCLNKINTCFDINYKNLSDVSIEGDLKGEVFQITLVIDDIHKLYINKPKSFDKVLECIQKMSKYDYLSWIISVNEFDAYIFDDSRNINFLSKYCVDFKNLYLENETMFDYTVNVTLFNNKFSIGNKILDAYNVKLYNYENNENNISGIYNPLSNPLYAHIIGNNFKGEEIISYVSTYLSFIIEIVELIDNKLNDFEHFNYTYINNAIINITNLVFKNKKVFFTDDELLGIVRKEIIDILWEYYLLRVRQDKKKNALSLRHLENRYELYTEIYWVLKMVLFQVENENSNCIRIYNNLSEIEEYKNDLIHCYLLYLDYTKNNSYNDIFNFLFRDHNINYALFCSPKASLDFKQDLCKTIQNTSTDSLNKIETFAMLYYLYYYDAKNNEKFKIICKCAKSIFDNGLLYNLNLVTDAILRKVLSVKKFKHDIRGLFNIGVGEVNSKIGYKCGLKLYDLCKNQDLKIQMDNIWMYLISHKEHIVNSTGTSFLDWLLRTYLYKIICKYGVVEIFNLLVKNGFFTYEGHKEDLELFFRRNFTCAAGNIYSSNPSVKYKEDYVEIVNVLMEEEIPNIGKKAERYIFAYHFISNSIKGEGNKEKIVDQAFVKYLKSIYNYDGLRQFCQNRKDFIGKNIKHWGKSETQIK